MATASSRDHINICFETNKLTSFLCHNIIQSAIDKQGKSLFAAAESPVFVIIICIYDIPCVFDQVGRTKVA